MAFFARFARLGKTGRLPAGSGKIPVAQSSASALAKDELLAVIRQVRDQFTRCGGGVGNGFLGFLG